MNQTSLFRSRRSRRGFTLVEVLVSSVLIAGLMILLLSTVDQTQQVWQRSRSKATQFQSARAAFEVMSRRLSQATLNTYWRAHEGTTYNLEQADFLFRRHSELQFVSGPMERFVAASPKLADVNEPVDENYPTHAMFFHAPLGYTENQVDAGNGELLRRFRSLDSMLTASGYFIEFGDDPNTPSFLRTMTPPQPERLRYRLMELTVPGEKFNIFARPSDSLRYIDPRIFDENNQYYEGMVQTNRRSNTSWVRPLWMKEALRRVTVDTGSSGSNQSRFLYARPLAENIVALIILPKLAEKDRVRPNSAPPQPDPQALELAPQYEFDSWRVLAGTTENAPNSTAVQVDNRARDNLLPPIVQVTMVAIDEPSAARLDLQMTDKPNWTQRLFRHVNKEEDYRLDVELLEEELRTPRNGQAVNYRIFTTDVVIRGSKWSRDPIGRP